MNEIVKYRHLELTSTTETQHLRSTTPHIFCMLYGKQSRR